MTSPDNFSPASSDSLHDEAEPAGTTHRADVAAGLVAVLLGIAVIVYALSLPTLGDGKPGPGLFPGIVGGAFVLFGLTLAVQTWTALRQRGPVDSPETRSQLDDLVGQVSDHPASLKTLNVSGKRLAANAAVIIVAIILYILLADLLGFLITMFVMTFAVMLSLRSKPLPAAITAVVLSVLMWLVFEELLRVQLPDGLLV
ncbi:tripartite tricarboxylate transporter TctB family protein [Arthrobacter subterraneus]|uniref:tripartite tricarboxylate transporter TctB family protein n=1 Tax=Arthrobacter subterraneus TaxID=335973 RepID=UPI0037F73A81